MNKIAQVLCVTGIVVQFSLLTALSYGEQQQIEVIKQIDMISKVLRNSIDEIHHGSGVAKLSISDESVEPTIYIRNGDGTLAETQPQKTGLQSTQEKYLVRFFFNNRSSRADYYEIADEEYRNPLSTFIVTPEQKIEYRIHDKTVVLKDAQEKWMKIKIGYSFLPEALIEIRRKSLFDWLKKLPQTYKSTNITTLDNGLFQICASGDNNKNKSMTAALVLDPKSLFRPIRFSFCYKNDELGTYQTDSYVAEWRLYSTVFFPTKLTYEVAQDITPHGLIGKHKVELQILRFDPNEQVKDSLFTLESLYPPRGTTVIDTVNGLQFTIP